MAGREREVSWSFKFASTCPGEEALWGMLIQKDKRNEGMGMGTDTASDRERYRLPGGEWFERWECETAFAKTYYVACLRPQASDDNPGTNELPFRTIGKAAEVLQPGERVVIEEGVYRERIQPARGGTDRHAMISYEAAEGHEVVVKGTELWQADWIPSAGYKQGAAQADLPAGRQWMGTLPAEAFAGTNPFSMANATSMPWVYEKNGSAWSRYPESAPTREYMMRRGLLFVDGKPLEQVVSIQELSLKPGAYWVEDGGLVLHFRLEDDGDPRDHVLEFTAREQLFVPASGGLAYVRLKGLGFEGAGNGFPAPQKGAVSTYGGHHWIVENCSIRWANAIGLDIGGISNHHRFDGPAGWHLIRHNTVSDCGVCGIAGVPSNGPLESCLIAGNRLERNCWHDVEQAWESGAIKIHVTRHCLVMNNAILDTGYGPAIWIDYYNDNSRITGNVIIGVKETMFGAVFIEASHKPNRVDGNLVWGVGKYSREQPEAENGGHGIYEHDSDALLIEHNVVSHVEGYAVYLNYGKSERIVAGRGPLGRNHRVMGNLLADCQGAILFPTPYNEADGNLYGDCGAIPMFKLQRPDETLNWQAWREYYGWDLHGRCLDVLLELDKGKNELVVLLREEHGAVHRTSIDLKRDFEGAALIDSLR